jgi:WD repeat-containing protein 61
VVREGADVVASGGMDDTVRIWDVTADGELKLRHKLTDHSLGVVSVSLNNDATRESTSDFRATFHKLALNKNLEPNLRS